MFLAAGSQARLHVLGAILLAILFGTAAPVSSQSSPQDEPPAVVTRSGRTISLSGYVAPSTLESVQREFLVTGAQPIDTLVIDSSGGDGASMMQLGRIVRDRKLTVRVDNICALFCAVYIAPAAERLVIPKGSFLIFTPIISPTMSLHARSTDEAAHLRSALASQDSYFREINIDPDRIYAIVRLISLLHDALGAAGKDDRPMLVAGSEYVQKCLGVPSVDMPSYSVTDSETLAHKFRVPIAFLLNGKLFYEGKELSVSQQNC